MKAVSLAGVTATVAVSLLAAGCGAGTSLPNLPGSHASPGPHHPSGLAAALTSCLRSNGYRPPPGFDPYSPSFRTIRLPVRATIACNSLLLKVLPPLTDQQKQEVIDFVVCMRKHGIPTTDPVFRGPTWQFSYGSGVDLGSPRYLNAQKACAAMLPQHGP